MTVLAGNDGNGGGVIACSRHLANHGTPVEVVLNRAPEDLDGVAARQRRVLASMDVGGSVGPDGLDPGDLVVDALVGYGVDGALRGTADSLVEALAGTTAEVVSLDVPSGLDATG